MWLILIDIVTYLRIELSNIVNNILYDGCYLIVIYKLVLMPNRRAYE